MRIALLSDIHSNYHALEAVLADMAGRGVDRLVCLGDITMKGPLPRECVDRMRSLGCPVVRGNTDSAYHPDYHPSRFPAQNESQVAARKDFARHVNALPESDRAWLRDLPLCHQEHVNGVRLDFFHATPVHNYVLVMPWASNDELATLQPAPDTRAFAFGHCHRPFVRFVRGVLVVNTGSVGIPFDGDPRPSYAVLDVAGDEGLTASIVRVPYDPEPAIRAAQTVGMIGWELFAHTVRTGNFPG